MKCLNDIEMNLKCTFFFKRKKLNIKTNLSSNLNLRIYQIVNDILVRTGELKCYVK